MHLLASIFLIFSFNKVIDIHLVQMTIDRQLLGTSNDGTCDPVDTKTNRECETEKC